MARPLLCRSDESLQSLVSLLHWQGLSVSFCIETLRDLSSDSGNTFSLSWTTRSSHPCLASAFRVLAFAFGLAVFALVFALRTRTDLHWHRLTVSVLLCSRDLEDFLSHLCPARDPYAVPDEVRFDPHVLHPQHCRRQLCRYVVFESVRQHVHQESNKFWLPFHYELSPCFESLVHACIVTLVQC